jgi:hypothetical protein
MKTESPKLLARSRLTAPLAAGALAVVVAVRPTLAAECASSQPDAGDMAGDVCGSAPRDSQDDAALLAPGQPHPAGKTGCVRGIVGSSTRGDLDPAAFFARLVRRYRELSSYRDTIRLVHVTTRDGEEASRVETEIGCQVRGGNLCVITPTSQTRDALSLALPVRHSKAAENAQRGYELWLAPHMTLKFDEEPLKHFRAGVEEGFTAAEAHNVTINDREMVQLELRSGDGLSEDCAAKFDLFVNPETMLVECIAGEQRMPDGASAQTTLHITPEENDGGEPTLMQ